MGMPSMVHAYSILYFSLVMNFISFEEKVVKIVIYMAIIPLSMHVVGHAKEEGCSFEMDVHVHDVNG